MQNYEQQFHNDYYGGWIGTAPATVLAENETYNDVQTVNFVVSQSRVLPIELSKLRLPYNCAPFPPKYNYCTWWRIDSSWDLKDMLKSGSPEKKPRDRPGWLGLISSKCLSLGKSEFLADATSGTIAETYLNTEMQEILYDEDLPVMLPPPVKSYVIKGRTISAKKAKPSVLPLEEESLLVSDNNLENDLPVQLPSSNTYTVKGKIN